MKALVMAVILSLLPAPSVAQQAAKQDIDVINWMRALNTLEMEYRGMNHKYATVEELDTFAQSANIGTLHYPSQVELRPYVLQVTLSPDAQHYQAMFKLPTNMQDRKTWCTTVVFSDDSGLIYTGKNIGCEQSGVLPL